MIVINKRILPGEIFQSLAYLLLAFPDWIVPVQSSLRRPPEYITLYQFRLNFLWV